MKRAVLFACLFVVLTGTISAQTTPRTGSHPSNGEDTVPMAAVTALELAEAMDIPAELINNASLGDSDPKGAAVFAGALGGFPTEGSSFSVLSTGRAKDAPNTNNEENLSTELDGLNTVEGDLANDLVQLTLKLQVPAGAYYWAVDFKFFSEEYEEYVGTSFNDAFLIETPQSTFVIDPIESTITAPNNVAFDPEGNLVSINTTGPTGMSYGNALGTTYDGATGLLTAFAPIPGGSDEIRIIFSVMDVGDSVYDTAVFLDNFRFLFGEGEPGDSTPPVIDVPPSPPNGDVFLVDIGETLNVNYQASDPDGGDTVTLQLLEPITGASFGGASGNPVTDTLSWTPQTGQNGVYIVRVIAKDNNFVASQPSSIVVVAGNIPPQAVSDYFEGPVNTTLDVFAPGLLDNDTDINEDVLTVNTTPIIPPGTGDLTLNADGSFIFIPPQNYVGVDTFVYQVTDGELTSQSTVVLAIGDNLLQNSGFEDPDFFDKKQADYWSSKDAVGDRRICNKPLKEKFVSFTGGCAYQFTGDPGVTSAISQSADFVTNDVNDPLLLTTWLKGEGVAGGKIKIVAKLTNGDKNKITFDVPPGTYDYTQIDAETVLTGTVQKVKTKVSIDNGSGKFWIDDVFVMVGEQAAVLGLPESSSLQSRK